MNSRSEDLISSVSLQQLRRSIRSVNRDVTGRAVLIARTRDVVERRRLRADRRHRHGRVTLQAELRYGRAAKLFWVHRAVRFMTAQAIAYCIRAMLVDMSVAFVGVTSDARQIAAGGGAEILAARSRVRIVAGRALHPTLSQTMRERLVAERARLCGMTRRAESELIARQKMW